MLKIKDSVDLKELEKFGLTYDKFYNGWFFTKVCDCCPYIIIYEDKGIRVYGKENLDIFYDLIKADLVEKVEND